MESEYRSHADEALDLANKAYDERDRTFWQNIAKAWLGLVELVRQDQKPSGSR